MLQCSENKHLNIKEMKTTTYYFELENETISIRMERKSHEELQEFKKQLNAKRVYITIRETKLYFDL